MPAGTVKDLDFALNRVTVREGKGNKDRVTVLPAALAPALRDQLATVRGWHEADLRAGFGRVYLPKALATKHPGAEVQWGWQYVFPSIRRSVDPRSGAERRHHLNESAVSRVITDAVRAAAVAKPATAHTLRRSFATHLTLQR